MEEELAEIMQKFVLSSKEIGGADLRSRGYRLKNQGMSGQLSGKNHGG